MADGSELDPRERFHDWDETYRRQFEGHQATIFTSIPGIIKRHNVEENTVDIQPAIKMKRVKVDGTEEWIAMPELKQVPIQYPSGGGVTITTPVKDGDEAWINFSMRNIERWWKYGGVQEQHDARMHDLSDGYVTLGPRSQPRKLKNVSSTVWQLRTDEETPTQVISFDPTSKTITIKSPNPVTVDAPSLRCTGEIIGKYNGDDIHLTTHVHPQQPDSHGDVEKDTDKPKVDS